MLKRQTFFPKRIPAREVSLISTMGLERPAGDCRHHPEWSERRLGKIRSWRHVCRYDTFSLVTGEDYHTEDSIVYTKWEDYIKISFWLRGRHTTVLDGLGQHDHDRPQVSIISAPRERMKIDLTGAGTSTAGLALCLRRDFFPVQMGLAWEELPEPLRALTRAEAMPYGFYQLPLTADLVTAARSILNAPLAVRRESAYAQAKAVELMCLLIDRMRCGHTAARRSSTARNGRESRLREARELLAQRYAEGITLDQISREVGLNRMALTSGFRELFGMSVHDCLTKERMEHAYELLQDGAYTIAQIAEAVGFSHSCTFSTAFHDYFGCSPQKARGNLARD